MSLMVILPSIDFSIIIKQKKGKVKWILTFLSYFITIKHKRIVNMNLTLRCFCFMIVEKLTKGSITMSDIPYKIYLEESEMPTAW